MKLLNSIVLFAAILFSSCEEQNEPQIQGSPTIVSQKREVGSFESVHIASVIDATIITGVQNVSLEANDNIVDLVKTEVVDNILYIDLEDGNYGEISINFSISNPVLNELSTVGVNNVVVSELNQSEELTLNIEGVGNIQMNGSINELIVNSGGSSNLEAFDFLANTCEVNLTGVGNIQVTVADKMFGALSGVGNILYKGSPEIDVDITGVGNIVDSN